VAELTHDTSEDGFHEIQLSGKQLVFLFMLGTGALVLVFLLGVQVGRDVRAERGEDAIDAAPVATAASGEPATAPAEPAAPVTDEKLSYSERLDKNPPAETLKGKPPEPEPVQETKPAAPEPAPPQPAATTPEATSPPPSATKPDPPAATRAAATVPTSGRAGRWVVQVITLSNRAGAAEITQGLIGKGYPAFLLMPPAGTPSLYRVQIGRYNDRAEADRVARRLSREENFKPEVKR
jgi:DedD protein